MCCYLQTTLENKQISIKLKLSKISLFGSFSECQSFMKSLDNIFSDRPKIEVSYFLDKGKFKQQVIQLSNNLYQSMSSFGSYRIP